MSMYTRITHKHKHTIGLTQENISIIIDTLSEIDIQSTELQNDEQTLNESLESIRNKVGTLLTACNFEVSNGSGITPSDCALIPNPSQLNIATDFEQVPFYVLSYANRVCVQYSLKCEMC